MSLSYVFRCDFLAISCCACFVQKTGHEGEGECPEGVVRKGDIRIPLQLLLLLLHRQPYPLVRCVSSQPTPARPVPVRSGPASALSPLLSNWCPSLYRSLFSLRGWISIRISSGVRHAPFCQWVDGLGVTGWLLVLNGWVGFCFAGHVFCKSVPAPAPPHPQQPFAALGFGRTRSGSCPFGCCAAFSRWSSAGRAHWQRAFDFSYKKIYIRI